MKLKFNFADFLRKCQFPVLFATGLFPAVAILLITAVPEAWPLSWAVPTAYVLLAWLCLVLPGKIRLVAGVVGCAALMGLGVYTMPHGADNALLSLFSPLLYSVLLLAGLRISSWPREQEIPFPCYAVGVTFHIVWQALVNLGTLLDFAATPMLWCFLLYLALMLLSMNRGSVNASAMGRQKISTVMRRQNLLLTIGLIALVLLIAALPAVIAAIENAWSLLTDLLARFMKWLTSLLPEVTNSTGGGMDMGGMDMGGMESSEPSLFAKIMEKVAMAMGALLGLAALYVAGRVVYRKLKVLLKYLWQRLNQYAAHSTEDYEDEITDTRETGEKQRTGGLQRLLRRERVDEKKLSPTEKIRYRYLKLLRRHADWHPGTTARENLPDAAAALYERARYSQHPITDQDAETFTTHIKQL